MDHAQCLVISVRVHDGRYHGMADRETREWPPSPARLFQALVAGVARGEHINDGDVVALRWLEGLGPPLIGAPRVCLGQRIETFVPDNDLDAVQGDSGRIAEIRSAKTIAPQIFDPDHPFLFVWRFVPAEHERAESVCVLANSLYQFGRGVDMAWAHGRVLTEEATDALIARYPGQPFRPTQGANGVLPCPIPGSLASLRARHVAGRASFAGQSDAQFFSQPPKPRFAQIAYDSPAVRYMFELIRDSDGSFGLWPLSSASPLVQWIRDGAAARLETALRPQNGNVERALVGKRGDGADVTPASARVRIIPLSSIGHEYADRGIRRVLVEIPPACPIRAADVQWAFSGLELGDPHTGEVLGITLTPSKDQVMLTRHYGVEHDARTWRTVTPAALPESAKRRRIEPTRLAEEAKVGSERAAEQGRAAAAFAQALRHAEVRARPAAIRVQREPFNGKGDRVEAFARGTRFAKERLWHVEVTFDTPVFGPLVIGDGRFLGLGLMAPVKREQGVHAFTIEAGLASSPSPSEVARALRRAVMSRVQKVIGERKPLSSYFSGHEEDGSPAQRERGAHLSFTFDPVTSRVLIVSPHVLERRRPTNAELTYLQQLDEALDGFTDLRAGSAGRLMLRSEPIDVESDSLFASSRNWKTVIEYQATRHAKHVGASAAISIDVLTECRRVGLPEPRVVASDLHGVPGVGVVATIELTFKVAVAGPIMLGRSRHLGGGLFCSTFGVDDAALKTAGQSSTTGARTRGEPLARE